MKILIIGAHPDDCEYGCGGTAALWRKQGYTVRFMSVTDGRSGHHEQDAASLVARRLRESREAAALIGADYECLCEPDGHLEPSLRNRLDLVRAIRRFNPEVLVTHRPNDYHPDHRYTSQLVQDAAFSLIVPKIAPDVSAMKRNPLIFHHFDYFKKPMAFAPDVVVDVDEVFEQKIAMLARHDSQFFEWLPWLDGRADEVPESPQDRLDFLREAYNAAHQPPVAELLHEELVEKYGAERGGNVKQCEAFEVCEHGAKPSKEDLKHTFPF